MKNEYGINVKTLTKKEREQIGEYLMSLAAKVRAMQKEREEYLADPNNPYEYAPHSFDLAYYGGIHEGMVTLLAAFGWKMTHDKDSNVTGIKMRDYGKDCHVLHDRVEFWKNN